MGNRMENPTDSRQGYSRNRGVEHPSPYNGLSGGTLVPTTQRSRGNDKIVVRL